MKFPVKEHCVKVARLYFPEQTVSISQQSLGDLVWGKSSRGAAWHLNKTTSQSPWSSPPSQHCLPNWERGVWESMRARASEAKPSILWPIKCSELLRAPVCLFTSFSTAIRNRPRQFFHGCLMVLELMVVSSGKTLLNRGPLHPPPRVSCLEICSCHFLLSLFTVLGCHNTSPGQWLDVHGFNCCAEWRKCTERYKIRAPPRPFLNSTWDTFTSLSLSLSLSLFLCQGRGVLPVCRLSFSPEERMRWAYWCSSTPEHHGHKLESRLQVWSTITPLWLTQRSHVVWCSRCSR